MSVEGTAVARPIQDPEPLLAQPMAVEFEDLKAILAGGLEPPTQLVDNLIIAGQVNWFSGHPSQGKTTVVMWAALQHIRIGGHVIWLDWEGGVRPSLLRLRALGASEDEIIDRFHYAAGPLLGADAAGLNMLRQALDRWPGALVVFDSASKALSVAGVEENENTEATTWTTSLVMPLRRLGATAVVIDHVTKGATSRTPYPRGAGSKLADAEVAWYVEATEKFNREQAGEVLLTCHKDRNGVLPREVRLRVGDGVGGLPVEVLDGPSGSGDRFDQIKRHVLDTLRKHDGEKLTVSQLKGLVTGKSKAIGDAARELGDELGEPVSSGPGPRNSVLYWHDETAIPEFARQVGGYAGTGA